MLNQKQPKGFAIFFLTEMWERYGFYILQSLLVFYALEKIHLSDSATYAMVGSFTALAYVNSIFGGIIADRYIGYEKAIMTGALLLCMGYLLLTIATGTNLFICGLAIVTVGTGMLKPNISSMLSMLYKDHPEKKDVGYTLFYVGIYFGAIGGSFLGGFIKIYLGWFAVFGSAAIGLAIALITFFIGKHKYKLIDPRSTPHNKQGLVKAALAILALVITAFFGIQNQFLSDLLFVVIGVSSIIFLIYITNIHQGIERKKLIAFGLLTIFSGLYWAVYFQQFFSVSLATARVTQLSLPASSLTAFESLGVIIFGPLVNGLFIWLQKRNKNLSIPAKFSLSFICNSASFLILILCLQFAISHNALLPQIFIISSYLIIALGELFLAPVGLAMVSTLVPHKFHGAMMGIFLMSIGLGGKLAGLLAQSSVTAANASIQVLEKTYLHSFTIYFIFSLIVFVLCLIMIKPINKLIQGTTHG